VPRQRRPSQNWHWGPKLPQMQNLGGSFVVFFLEGQNRNFVKVRGLKLQLRLYELIWLCIVWVLWNERNNMLFSNYVKSISGKSKIYFLSVAES